MFAGNNGQTAQHELDQTLIVCTVSFPTPRLLQTKQVSLRTIYIQHTTSQHCHDVDNYTTIRDLNRGWRLTQLHCSDVALRAPSGGHP